jgi:hypothetical protein
VHNEGRRLNSGGTYFTPDYHHPSTNCRYNNGAYVVTGAQCAELTRSATQPHLRQHDGTATIGEVNGTECPVYDASFAIDAVYWRSSMSQQGTTPQAFVDGI